MLDFWSMNIYGTTSIKQRSNAAGLQKFSLIGVTDIDSIVLNPESWSILASGIKTVASYYIYEFKFKAGAYTEEKELTEHGYVYRSTIELLIARDDAYRCISAKSLTNQRFIAVIEDLNGICKVIGLKKQPVKLTSSKLENSTKNTYRFVFESVQKYPSLFFEKGTDIFSIPATTAPTIPTEFLKVGDLAVSILATKTSLVIPVISNLSFTTSENASWFDVSAVSPSSVSLSIQVNTATTSRSGSLTITAGGQSKTIVITQEGATTTTNLVVSPSSLSYSQGSSTQIIYIVANVGYNVSTPNSWITITQSGTLGAGYYVIAVSSNATTAVRNGSITVIGGGITRSISVSQAGTTPVPITDIPSTDNITKTLAPLANGVTILPLSSFVDSTKLDTPTYMDGLERRNTWEVWWQAGNVGFSSSLWPWHVNLSGADKYIANFGGFARRGQDYVLTENPDTGQPWSIDPVTVQFFPPNGKTPAEFISAIPTYHRMDAQTNISTDPNWTQEQWYDAGKSCAINSQMGNGDNVERDGKMKSQRGLIAVDIENFVELSSNQVAFLLGMSDGTVGRMIHMYLPPFNYFGKSMNYTNNGLEGKMNMLYPDLGSYLNAYQFDKSPVWDYQNPERITLPSRGITNKSVLDTNVTPGAEISSMESWFRTHGTTNQKADGSTYTINKFGALATWTDVSPLYHFGVLLETWSWYCINKLGCRFTCMSKLISDKGPLGSEIEVRKNVIVNRKWGFLIGLLTYMNGCNWYIWGGYSNLNTSQDGYLGALGMLKMVRESGGYEKFQEMIPVFWDTEYSLDNGVTWKKSKAQNWADSLTTELAIRVKMSNTHYEIAAFRGEGLEPVSAKVRIVKGLTVIEKNITADMWATVSYEHRNTALADIPTAHKHYYYNIFTF